MPPASQGSTENSQVFKSGEMARIPATNLMKDKVSLQHKLDDQRAQLAEVELEIKLLLQELEKKRIEAQQLKEAIEDRQESEQRILEALSRAAEALDQLRSALDALT